MRFVAKRKQTRNVGRTAYLILLWDTKPWSDAEAQSVQSGKAAELGCPVKLLKTIRVQGAFPTGPDEFVVSTAVLVCREHGIPFETGRDTISFSGGEFRPGEGAGLITIEIRAFSDQFKSKKSPPSRTEYSYTPRVRKLVRKADIEGLVALVRRPTKGKASGPPTIKQKERAWSMHALMDLLEHADTTVRARAEGALSRLLIEEEFAQETLPALLFREKFLGAVQRTPQLKVQVVDVLIAQANSSNSAVRATRIWGLGALKDPRAIPVLRGLLMHSDDLARQRASEALAALEPTLRDLADKGDAWASQQLRELDERIEAEAGAKAAEAEAAAQAAAEEEAQQMVEAHSQHGSVDFDADGRVANVNLPAGNWTLEERGQTRYYTQRASSLLHATELLRSVSSVPEQTYYTVETPDGTLSRDIFGFYTEGPIKTKQLTLVTSIPASGAVESVSLTAYGDAKNSQIGVAQLKLQGHYAKFVLLMECGHCGYRSPVETDAGPMQRQCYCCGATNNTTRSP